MSHNQNIIDRVKEEQKRMFRLALDATRYGLTLKAISIDSGLGYDAIRSYARGDAVMSAASIYALCGVIPDELISLLLPAQFVITRKNDEIHVADVAAKCMNLISEYASARREDSEAGPAIGPNESERLSACAVGLSN